MEHKLIQGGEQYLPFARARIKAMRAAGLRFAAQQFVIGDVSVKVRLDGDHDYISIGGDCADMESGILLRGWNLLGPPPANTEALESFYPSQAQAGNEPRAWKLGKKYPEMKPSTHGSDFLKFKLRFLTHQNPPGIDIPAPPGWVRYTEFPQVAVIRPGMYTGSMRKVIQYMLGARSPVKLDYRFDMTHGIMNVPNAKGGTTPWVIEISAKNGVLATKLRTCKRKDSAGKPNDLGYTPLGAALPCENASTLAELIEKKVVIRLLPASALLPFYGSLGPLFAECGWAFSYSGNEAQNTGIGWSGNYQTASRFKLTFATSDGKPSSATLALVDSGYMVGIPGTEYARSQIRIPSYTLQGCVTLDMRPFAGNFQGVDSICPIYVYYDGDVEQVVTWHNEMLVPNPAPDLPDYDDDFDPYNPSCYGTPYYVSGNIFGGKSRYYQIRSPVHPNPDLYTYGSNLYTYTPVAHGAGYNGYCWCVESSGVITLYLITIYSALASTVVGSGKGSRHTVSIPLYEREAFYHYKEETDYSQGYGGGIAETFTVINGASTYTNYQDIDNFGNPFGPYKWKFREVQIPTVGSGGNTSSGTIGALSPAWPASYYGSDWESPEDKKNEGRVAVPPVMGSAPISEDDFTTRATHDVARSGSPPLKFLDYSSTVSSPESSWWLARLPRSVTGAVSQLWMSRSADGLHIVPLSERSQGMTPSQFEHNLTTKGYPADLALSAPWVVYIGAAGA